jgi:hypothetical protein
MSKDLIEYKSNTQQINQLRHLSKIEKSSFLKGTIVESKHYNFIFKEGPFYGRIDLNNKKQINFLNNPKTQSSTLLIDSLFEYYSDLFSIYSIGVSKTRVFELDTNSIMDKLFDCLKYVNENFKTSFMNTKNKVFSKENLYNNNNNNNKNNNNTNDVNNDDKNNDSISKFDEDDNILLRNRLDCYHKNLIKRKNIENFKNIKKIKNI